MFQIPTNAPHPRADVVIPVYGDVALTRTCVEAVLAHSGEALARLILVDDCGPDPEMRPMLRRFRDADPRVHLLENAKNLGFVGTANRGLALCEGDAVILNSDTRVTEGWLASMLAVLNRSERIAAVSPLSNNGTLCSVPDFGQSAPEEVLGSRAPDLSSLPEWTELPTGNGFCLLMRGTARAALGLFDPAFGRGYNEENDWCQRARSLGLSIARANRAFVFHRGEVSFAGARKLLDLRNSQRLVARHPNYLAENRAFAEGPEAHLAASAVRAGLGRMRLALHPGLRRLPAFAELSEALATSEDVESLRWLDESGKNAAEVEVLLAPLDHPSDDAARQTLAGTGRLITVVDAWRPVAHGRRRALRWAQLVASDLVLVPSRRAATWVLETGPLDPERVRIVPFIGLDSQPGGPDAEHQRTRVVLVAPAPSIKALCAEALALLSSPMALEILGGEASPMPASEALRGAAALVDLGGTSCGWLGESARLGVPILWAGLSVADALSASAARRLDVVTPRALARHLEGLLAEPRAACPPVDASAPSMLATWRKAIQDVVSAPRGTVAGARAALQLLAE